jgi:hypothetical protein
MPSKSPAQARLMAAVAHNPAFAARVGIPQSVGREFNLADTGTGIRNRRTAGTLQQMQYRGPERRRSYGG